MDIYILEESEEVLQKTDDQFLRISNIIQSKYAASIRDRAEKQFQYLRYA